MLSFSSGPTKNPRCKPLHARMIAFALISSILTTYGCQHRREAAVLTAAGIAPGEYRGFERLAGILSERLLVDGALTPGRRFEIPSFVKDAPRPLDAAGVLDEDGVFRNGSPNAFNALLYVGVLEAFARVLAERCDPDSPPQLEAYDGPYLFNEEFLSALRHTCALTDYAGEAASKPLDDLWLVLMAYDAQSSERTAWKSYLAEGWGAYPDGRARAAAAIAAIFLNPFFLIER